MLRVRKIVAVVDDSLRPTGKVGRRCAVASAVVGDDGLVADGGDEGENAIAAELVAECQGALGDLADSRSVVACGIIVGEEAALQVGERLVNSLLLCASPHLNGASAPTIAVGPLGSELHLSPIDSADAGAVFAPVEIRIGDAPRRGEWLVSICKVATAR